MKRTLVKRILVKRISPKAAPTQPKAKKVAAKSATGRPFVKRKWVVTLAPMILGASGAVAFENAKVLPKGVRSVNIRTVETEIDQTTDGSGKRVPLAEPLNQQLTFKKIAQGEDGLKAEQLRAFLTSNAFAEDESVGEFTADLKGHISVVAPITSYGVTDRLTLAVAIPIYTAQTSIAVGFQPNETAAAFLATLARTENNQTAAAHEAGAKLNNAVGELNTKLASNGYRELEDWEAQGIGDMTIAAKQRFLDMTRIGGATTMGVVAPTGRTDDPDILNDIAFGDGQWDIFGQLAFDQEIADRVVLNQHGKYTVQLPGDKNVRAVTADEEIEVQYTETRFKLGDKIDAGTSIVWEPRFGLVTGIGYTYFRKYGDVYRELNPATKVELEEDTDQVAHNGEAVLGYSTVPLYQAGSFAVPLELKLSYTKQFVSKNMPVSDLAQLDFSLFF